MIFMNLVYHLMWGKFCKEQNFFSSKANKATSFTQKKILLQLIIKELYIHKKINHAKTKQSQNKKALYLKHVQEISKFDED